ncbi:unnamed protein product [Schistosoma margrebowiei]|uniref:Uncharacterized protein n=1 Tax=Schistosoma margrebowiei TaxID=48269 RepID=A0A183M6C4_9TREM|nr:unnamed protein product [Schistosoma margrebowiei]
MWAKGSRRIPGKSHLHKSLINDMRILTNSTLSKRFHAFQDLLDEEGAAMESNWKGIKEALTSTGHEITGHKKHHHKGGITVDTLDRIQERMNKKVEINTSRTKAEWTDRMQLNDLDFADDLAYLSHTQHPMQEMTSFAQTSAAVGLNVHKGKRKILRYNRSCNNLITIDGEDLEDVKVFTYLDSIIDEHGGSDANAKARISKEGAACLPLKNI